MIYFAAMKAVIGVLFLVSISNAATTQAGCELSLKVDLPKKNAPLYLVTDCQHIELALPVNGSIDLKPSEDLLLACTGGSNTLNATGEEVSQVLCVSGDSVLLNGKMVETEDLDCKSRSRADLVITNTKCTDVAVIIQSGFQVREDYFPMSFSCHNIDEASTLWSRHTLYGSRLAGKVISSARPGFSRGDKSLYSGFNPNDAYKQSNQEVVFGKLFGVELADKYIKIGVMFLSRGHLSPDADFLFGTWQMSTYFFVNVAPQWQSINAGYWLRVEENTRDVAINMKEDLTVITGTFGVLALPRDNGQLVEIYLEGGNRLPVPEWFWKLLVNPKDKSCIVLVSTNNPFLKEAPQLLCPDKCKEAGWPEYKEELEKGYIYCCDYHSFKRAVPMAPSAHCDSLLPFK